MLVGADTGGSTLSPLEITYYHLYVQDALTANSLRIHSIAGSESSYLVENLKAGVEYTFRLQAENALELLSQTSTA